MIDISKTLNSIMANNNVSSVSAFLILFNERNNLNECKPVQSNGNVSKSLSNTAK